ncbi:hypothetical protein LSUB1_G005772 [Lachnellula subtilissima]|uniref:Uncharacterized protein n=1 Tax=Lachnellula subtilissima TaxID=602034 RepID=A0A8H8RQV4_9HELO|nr:hypothetical protein LSUB1_G005772 [Lachnellula subtilissima]
MLVNLRQRTCYLAATCIIFIFCIAFYLRTEIALGASPIVEDIQIEESPIEEENAIPQKPKYKPEKASISPPIIDNFPLAAAAHSASELPTIAPWNAPPSPHVPESTPLFIGFTRNWRLLQQVVVSYITSGWPPEDIYVVENTGVMNSNKNGELSLQNPFFLNHTRLNMLGVNVLVTPTLFTFAQLQNFYLYTSIQNEWKHYFWSHMDVVAVSYETSPPDSIPDPNSIYTHCVSALRDTALSEPETGAAKRWAMRFFAYDNLALVNVAAFIEVGGWDTMIPFYMGDCDMHARIEMAGLGITDGPAGLIYDVASALDDLLVLYRKVGVLPEWTDPNVLDDELRAIAEEAERKAEESRLEVERLEKGGAEKEKGKREIPTEVIRDAAGGILDKNEIDLADQELHHEFLPPSPPPSSPLHTSDTPNSPTYFAPLLSTLDRMQNSKHASRHGRNTWQGRQTGGIGEPFYRDSEGFERAIGMTIDHGRAVFAEKWGHKDCDIVRIGMRPGDAWRVERDW